MSSLCVKFHPSTTPLSERFWWEVLVLLVLLVTGVKQSQLLVLRLSLEFDNINCQMGESNHLINMYWMLIVWTMMMVMMMMSHPTQNFVVVICYELFWLMKWTTVEPPQIWEWHISKQNDDDWEENTITQYQGLVGSLVSFIMLILTNCTECHVWDRTAWNITYTCTQGIHLMLKLYFTSCIKTCAPSPRGVVPWIFVLKITSHWNGLIFNGLLKSSTVEMYIINYASPPNTI